MPRLSLSAEQHPSGGRRRPVARPRLTSGITRLTAGDYLDPKQREFRRYDAWHAHITLPIAAAAYTMPTEADLARAVELLHADR